MGIQLIRNPDYCFEIQGHVNAPGVPASQVMTYMDLSKSRAGRVYQWLIDKGMKADRMIPVGYGHLQMLFPNSRDEASQEKKPAGRGIRSRLCRGCQDAKKLFRRRIYPPRQPTPLQ
ncbi:MAG: OmpA family protein [Saprospiraceae bacterium]|nr:OmpA family protein [Saprospiraceae bacterium]